MMDWDYLFSLSPEDLTDEEKDALYNSVIWFNCEKEELDINKCVTFIKINQEVLKYKGEQVEVLLHKLDELATQQGEEVRRIESDTDAKSSKSRKSSSLEYENLEQKYLDLKSKHKKQVRINEKNLNEIKKFQQKINNLEQEKNRLINELHLAGQEDTHSDVSETVKEQHKELIDTVHLKNKQISDLLRDIGTTEEENIILREKLTTVRDELATATKEITELTENVKALKIQQEDASEQMKKLTVENENLQEEIGDILEQKRHFEHEMEEFTEEVNSRVDEWKKILEEKEREISELRSRQMQSSHHSSTSSMHLDEEQEQGPLYNRIIIEKDKQILEMKTQLQKAVVEMEEATEAMKILKDEKINYERKIESLSESIKDMKKQMKRSNERCQELQNNLTYSEELLVKKNNDVKEILERLKEDGESDLSDLLEQIDQLKSQNRSQEKQIMDLVNTTNKLQDHCNAFEKENEVLREKLDLGDEAVDSTTISIKRRQQRKEMLLLKKQIQQLEEDKVQLKMQIHQQKNIHMENKENIEEGNFMKEQLNALVEENEALRKGLHEILDSVNSKRESGLKEVKSQTLEKLLRALDVKHISGWYHPAMRLQAELHSQEGINAELREQLRLARLESQSARSVSEKSADSNLSSIMTANDLATINNIHQTLQDLFTKMEIESARNEELEIKLTKYKENFIIIQQQITLLYQEYLTEKQNLVDKISEYEEKMIDLEDQHKKDEEKLNLLINETSDDENLMKKSLQLAEDNAVLKRKRDYLENSVNRLTLQITSLQNDLNSAEIVCVKKINDLSLKNSCLKNTLDSVTEQLKFSVDVDDYNVLKNNFENLTVKYRDLLANFRQIEKDKQFQFKMLEEIAKNLQKEKSELESKLITLHEKLHKCHCVNNNETEESLANKLAVAETNEINERQRADHTNNLYELVKEQLQKSEERCKQIDKYNTEILQKNLVLQEQLKDAENKLINYVDIQTYKSLQSKHNDLLQANEKLSSCLNDLKEEINVLKKSAVSVSYWNSEGELLDLKHQIIDLQAVSDEKMQIARLSNELHLSKMQEADRIRKIEHLTEQLSILNNRFEEMDKETQRRLKEVKENENELRKKVSTLRELLLKYKLQYLGCVPLSSEEKFVNNIRQAIVDKQEAFLSLYNAQIAASESAILKEHYEKQLTNVEQTLNLTGADFESIKEFMLGYQDKKFSQFNEIRFRRQTALKDTQLQHMFERVKIQDEQIIKLEEELFALHKNLTYDLDSDYISTSPSEKINKSEILLPKFARNIETQTEGQNMQQDDIFENLHIQISALSKEIENKDQAIEQLKIKLTEEEMNTNLLKKQLGDKQSQIMFYERHILELQSNKEMIPSTDTSDKSEEISTLKCSLKTFQDILKQKEEDILKYQSLLKEDRDKHSMAASLMRDELKVLQKCLNEEKQKVIELKASINGVHPSKAALEQYFLQVHSLEDELSDLRTKVSTLESQLQASRQEAVRWRILANDRLETMQQLGKDLEDLHRNEIIAYKNEAEKWRDEVINLKHLIKKYRSDIEHDSDFQKLIRDKDDRIHELSVLLRHAKRGGKSMSDKSDSESLTKVKELETTKEQLLKEHEAIKKRFDQLLVREKSAREEIRELKGKLIKKPILSARSDRSEKSVKEQLQKKISNLEKENVELKENLAKQISINESHKEKIAQDFERWSKQKHYQQLSDKLKIKLKTKEKDFEKLQETCAGYRVLIERLEREKYNLETKLRNMKFTSVHQNTTEIEMLKLENMKLMAEIESLTSKLEMQQHHSGGLGAAMLQEKLEAQERKIAILELSNKGSVEVRGEIERLQNSVSNLQKTNLCLEAENLELKLDLEKSTKEVPHLRDQIQHLESYIEVLKKESAENANTTVGTNTKADAKKVSELERTIFVLKRVVEKLQAENKKLLTGKRYYSDRIGSGDKLKRDYQQLKQDYCVSLQKITKLEEEIKALKSYQNKLPNGEMNHLSDELKKVKEELEQKTQLLNKVKILLQRAAIKEKALLQELEELKLQVHKPQVAPVD